MFIKNVLNVCKPVVVAIDYVVNVLCNPFMWVSIEISSKRVDGAVNTLIKQYESGKATVAVTDYYARFMFKDGSYIDVWIENYPYAFGKLHGSCGFDIKYLMLSDNIPYRYTKLKLRRLIKKVKRQERTKLDINTNNIINKIETLGD